MTRDRHLEALLADQQAVDTERVAAALKGKITIDSATGSIVLDVGFDALGSDAKVLSILLGQMAAVLLGLQDEEAVSAKDVIDVSGIPSGTVHPTLRDLRQKRLVTQDSERRYTVPRNKILPAIEVIDPYG